MSLPKKTKSPFDLDLAVFLVGPDDTDREPDIDYIYSKPFRILWQEFLQYDPEGVSWGKDNPRIPSRLVEGYSFIEVPAGILLLDSKDEPVGGYLSCDLAVDEEHQGQGLGKELIIHLVHRTGSLPTWFLDEPAYSPEGYAAHVSAWEYARAHPEILWGCEQHAEDLVKPDHP